MDTLKPQSRRFQFSLRTMLVGLAVVAVGFGCWVNRSREWIRQRHEALGMLPIAIENAEGSVPPRAPGGLWIFGEAGVPPIAWTGEDTTGYEQIEELFPEAVVYLSIKIYDVLPDHIIIVPATEKVVEEVETRPVK